MGGLNYFEHFGIQVSFLIDEKELKRLYLFKSRELHPDFYTLHDEGTQEEMLQQSSFNNLAFNVLNDPMKRMKYILDLNNCLINDSDNPLPQEFLMEMMDINEALMELSMDYNVGAEKSIRNSILEIEKSLREEVSPFLKRYDHFDPNDNDLNTIKEFYFKSRYLWRLKENLNKFASP